MKSSVNNDKTSVNSKRARAASETTESHNQGESLDPVQLVGIASASVSGGSDGYGMHVSNASTGAASPVAPTCTTPREQQNYAYGQGHDAYARYSGVYGTNINNNGYNSVAPVSPSGVDVEMVARPVTYNDIDYNAYGNN